MLWPSWDTSVFFHVNGIESGPLTLIMRTISNVDNWIPFIIGSILLLIWWGRTKPHPSNGSRWKRSFASRNPRIVILCLVLATAGSDQICYHLKHTVNRSRPCMEETISGEVNYRGDVYGNRSFPSAHSANSAALATTTALAYPPLAPVAVLIAFLVGLSRIYLGVHYPIDVLAGWCIGVMSAVAVWMIFRKMLSKQGIIGFTNRFRFRQPAPDSLPQSPWKRVDITSLDGYSMTGYFLESGKDLVIMVHGLHSSITSISAPALIFNRLGFSVFLVPLRGHDGHEAPVTTGGPGEVYDLAGALSHVRDEMGFPRDRTIIYGSSMGGTVALKMSGILSEPVVGVISHGAYSTFFNAARMKLGGFRTAILKFFLPCNARKGLEIFQPGSYIRHAHNTGYVFLSGDLDLVSPPETGMQLSSLSKGLSVLLIGAGHPFLYNSYRWSEKQMETAFRISVEFIKGRRMKPLAVDESGFICNFPASLKSTEGRRK